MVPELFARFGIAHCSIVCALRHSDGEGRDGYASTIEHLHAVDKSFTLVSKQLITAKAAIFKNQFSCGAGAQPQFFFLLADAESFSPFFHDECGDAMIPRP